MDKRDYYEILGVDRKATESEIKKQFKKLAKEHHPDKQTDKNKAAESEELFKEINEAYKVLSDKEKRKMYDQYGHSMGQNFGNNSSDIDDLFRRTHESFFGVRQEYVQPIRLNVSLTLMEMYLGVTKKFKFKAIRVCNHCNGLKYNPAEGGSVETCKTCNGSGQQTIQNGRMIFMTTCQDCGGAGHKIKNGCKHCHATGVVPTEQTITLDAPKGIFGGANIRFDGVGNEAIINGKSIIGDVIVFIVENDNTIFNRNGDDIHVQINVPILDCMLGNTVTVDSIDGKTNKFKLKVGTDAGEKFRLAGLGMPKLSGSGYGDFYVHIAHEMPKTLTEKEIGMINELKTLMDNGK